MMSRPRGYFGVGRDKFSLDGKVPPGINDGVPGAASGRLAFDAGAAHGDGGVQHRDDRRPHLAREGKPHRRRRVHRLRHSRSERLARRRQARSVDYFSYVYLKSQWLAPCMIVCERSSFSFGS